MILDHIIIGGGPSGLTFSYLLKKANIDFILIEKGQLLKNRVCPLLEKGTCYRCPMCSIIYGVGGGGFFSDGKVIETSGWDREDYSKHEIREATNILKEILNLEVPFKVYNPFENKNLEEILSKIYSKGFNVSVRATYWYGSTGIRNLASRMYYFVRDNVRVLTEAHKISKDGGIYKIETNRKTYLAKNVVISTGRFYDWTKLFLNSNVEVSYTLQKFYIGVRVEVLGNPWEKYTEIFRDFKVRKYGVKTFCFNPYGRVIIEDHKDWVSVNGFSDYLNRTSYTNFAVVSKEKIPLYKVKKPLYIGLHDFLYDENIEVEKEMGTLRYRKYDNNLKSLVPEVYKKFLIDFIDLSKSNKVYGILYYPEIKTPIPVPHTYRFKIPNENIFFVGEAAGRIVGIWASMISSILLYLDLIREVKKEMQVISNI